MLLQSVSVPHLDGVVPQAGHDFRVVVLEKDRMSSETDYCEAYLSGPFEVDPVHLESGDHDFNNLPPGPSWDHPRFYFRYATGTEHDSVHYKCYEARNMFNIAIFAFTL